MLTLFNFAARCNKKNFLAFVSEYRERLKDKVLTSHPADRGCIQTPLGHKAVGTTEPNTIKLARHGDSRNVDKTHHSRAIYASIFRKWTSCEVSLYLCSGGGSVGRAFAFYTRGPQFDSASETSMTNNQPTLEKA